MEKMTEVVPDTDEQSLQHFISNSNWDEPGVLDKIVRHANDILGGKNSGLLIDDSGFAKKGVKSVGVARQWCGQLGKVDNCQVAVFGTLANGSDSTIIAKHLYLPEEWFNDKDRCKEAGVPDSILEGKFKTKIELAKDIITSCKEKGVEYGWIGFDDFYGRDGSLLRSIQRKGDIFMADIPSSTHVYLEDPQPELYQYIYKGEEKEKYRSSLDSVRVDKIISSLDESVWKRCFLRKGTKGDLIVNMYSQIVWIWNESETEAYCWHLVVRRELNSPDEIKYSLSNAHQNTSLEKLGYMQSERYWVERPFQDGKNEVGMGDYQVRGWNGWNHHMTLVMLALLFIADMRIETKEEYGLLSAHDIKILLAKFLPRCDLTKEEVIFHLEKRHQKRRRDIEYCQRKQAGEQLEMGP